jgi:HEPN domain-containing protein
MRFWPPLTEEQGMKALLRRAGDALSDLELALSTAGVSVERGRQNDAARMTVEALARLYIDVAGRDPKRSYDDGEDGEFLKLAQTFINVLRVALPPAVASQISPSQTKVVREVLAELRS